MNNSSEGKDNYTAMEENNSSLLERAGETFGYLQQHIQKRLELYQLEITEWSVRIISSLTALFLISGFLGLIVLFGSLAIGFFLSEWLGSQGLAFLILTGFYLLLTIIIFVFRRQLITHPILHLLLKEIQEEFLEDEREASLEEKEKTNGTTNEPVK